MDKLTELISAGPDPRYTMKSLVLERYADIADARRLMRTWPDIAEALGLPKKRGKDLAGCFARVDRGIRAGKLMTGRTAQSRKSVEQRPVVASTQPLSQTRGLPPGASQSASDVEALRAKGVKVHS